MGAKNRHAKSGLPPGALIHVGEARSERPLLTWMAYGPSSHATEVPATWAAFKEGRADWPVHWVNLDGVHLGELVSEMGSDLGMHALHIEDVMNTDHRPAFFELENGGFGFILKMVGLSRRGRRLVVEQLSVVASGNAVASFQERSGDVFAGLRERLERGGSKASERGAEYLAYRLVDTVVDHYYHVTDHLMEAADRLEERVFAKPDSEALMELQRLNKQVGQLRRAAVPLREALSQMFKDPPPLVELETLRHWQDVQDHLTQVSDQIDSLRETVSALFSLHASGVSQRTNQVMQWMTMVATLFIPLTFVVGVYGMNFAHMPELEWRYGYVAVWCVLIAIALFMYRSFRKRGWM